MALAFLNTYSTVEFEWGFTFTAITEGLVEGLILNALAHLRLILDTTAWLNNLLKSLVPTFWFGLASGSCGSICENKQSYVECY